MTMLTETDKRVLDALEGADTELSTIAQEFDDPSELRERLTQLLDVGLVDEPEAGMFQLTASGQRVLATSREETMSDRTTLQPKVVRVIEAADLRPDREAAIRSAYLFLRYWGDATPAEITAAIFPEYPAQYESPENWWENSRELLASLPPVDPSGDRIWQCSASKEEDHGDDGRHVTSNYGSVRHTIKHLSNTDRERRSIRAAFAYLYWSNPCSVRELKETVYPEFPGGYNSAEKWWIACIKGAFEQFPDVEPSNSDYRDEQEWHVLHDSSNTVPSETSDGE